ncbi:hypothetical protein B9G69_012180 [Bdellovibrio sp. SKB1291214]|uniref:hypothetical protein n=1 Tax=Bdellovibrio sp. SKB1291214 TaxID=1732569 RepID=UPI000B519548|nr:hypothetical protein [Bdellovibrio sp. SKB1291214]UYL07803.1 hypothetical protein B9G69_012180 [Bdellovibrio sp. SKB1291214]
MKKYVVVLATLVCFGCAHKNQEVKTPEVVASCFGDGENQELCKAERINDENKVVTTRCVGAQNRNALASLRGKCVEKICSPGSNTDCQIRGEVAVLDQYSELVRHRFFDDDDGSAENSSKAGDVAKSNNKKGKNKKSEELDVDPTAKLPKLPAKAEPVAKKVTPKPVSQTPAEPAPIHVTLKADTTTTTAAAPAAAAAPTVAKATGAPKQAVATKATVAKASSAAASKGRKPASVSGASEISKKGCASKKKDGKSSKNAKCLVRAKN